MIIANTLQNYVTEVVERGMGALKMENNGKAIPKEKVLLVHFYLKQNKPELGLQPSKSPHKEAISR